MKQYEVSLEIEGAAAMWTRPDTGDAPVSYPAPTFSATKGIFESLLWLKSAEVVPQRVEICAPLVYHTYSTNYGGPLRKSEQIRKGNNFQLIATILVNVRYRLYAEVVTDQPSRDHLTERGRVQVAACRSGAHAYQEMFQSCLERGQFARVPCLGWQEFIPSYLGPFRSETRIQENIGFVLPSMLHAVFPSGKFACRNPVFRQNVRIEKGVLHYAT